MLFSYLLLLLLFFNVPKIRNLVGLYEYFSPKTFVFKGGHEECSVFMQASKIFDYVRQQYIDPVLTARRRKLIRYLNGGKSNLRVQCSMPGALDN